MCTDWMCTCKCVCVCKLVFPTFINAIKCAENPQAAAEPKKFGLQPVVFESWIMTIAGLRNICCHHSRLWNRELPIQMTLPKRPDFAWLSDSVDIKRTYFRLCMIKYLLFSVSPNNSFKEKVVTLVKLYPTTDTSTRGRGLDDTGRCFAKIMIARDLPESLVVYII